MPHSIRTRPLEESERQSLERWAGGTLSDDALLGVLGCTGVFFVTFLCVIAFARVAESFGIETWGAPLFFWILALVPTAAGVAVSTRVIRRRVAARRARRRQIAIAHVQLLRVEHARVLEHEPHNDEGPIYYFDIGDGKVLCLRGAWMLDLDYGLMPGDPRLGWEGEHMPFPAEAFTVHRLALGGDVLKIDEIGPYLPPEGMLPFRATLPPWMAPVRESLDSDSLLIDGNFDELVAIVQESARSR